MLKPSPYSHITKGLRRGGVVVRASVLQSVDLVESYQRLQKMVFTAFLLDVKYEKENGKKNRASLPVLSLEKALNGISLSLCNPQVADRAIYPT